MLEKVVTCQYFLGYSSTRLQVYLHSLLVISNHWLNEVSCGCKRPQCIQIQIALPVPEFGPFFDLPTRLLTNERTSLRPHCPNNNPNDSGFESAPKILLLLSGFLRHLDSPYPSVKSNFSSAFVDKAPSAMLGQLIWLSSLNPVTSP